MALLAVAALTVLLVLWMSSGSQFGPEGGAAPSAAAPANASGGAATAPVPAPPAPSNAAQQPPSPAAEGDADPTRDIKSYIARGENPSMNQVIERLHERGIHSGLGAFSPPGTSPPLVGLAVPEDFALPKGYVRHHQATDDGQRIEAILMFAPDFQPVDANNKPVDVPKDRVVPPELAPPGLPIRRIVIPAPIEAVKPGH